MIFLLSVLSVGIIIFGVISLNQIVILMLACLFVILVTSFYIAKLMGGEKVDFEVICLNGYNKREVVLRCMEEIKQFFNIDSE